MEIYTNVIACHSAIPVYEIKVQMCLHDRGSHQIEISYLLRGQEYTYFP